METVDTDWAEIPALGCRHVDTAEYYDNERAVGDGMEAASVGREAVFLVVSEQADQASRWANHSANFASARPRWEILFFSAVLISANVCPSNSKTGS